MMNKKAMELAFNQIVILIIILIVLVIVILFFTGAIGKIFPAFNTLINSTVDLSKTVNVNS